MDREYLLWRIEALPVPTADILPFVEDGAQKAGDSGRFASIVNVIKSRDIRSLKIASLLLTGNWCHRVDPSVWQTVCQCGGPEFERMLLRRLSDPNVTVRAAAARVLSGAITLPTEVIIQEMYKLLNEEDLVFPMIALDVLENRVGEYSAAIDPLRTFIATHDGPLAAQAKRLVSKIEYIAAFTKSGEWSTVRYLSPTDPD